MYQHMYIFLMPIAMHCTGRAECTPLVGLSRSLAHVFCGGVCFVHIAARQKYIRSAGFAPGGLLAGAGLRLLVSAGII